MNRNTLPIIYVVVMIIVIVAADLLFFRHQFRQRLIANIVIVLVFAIFYLMLLKHR